MSFAHTLNLQEVLRAAGVKGGQQPGITQALLPVILMADFSQTYSGEPLEARGIAGTHDAAIPLGERGIVLVQALAPGGIVCEFVQLSIAVSGSAFAFVDRVAAPPAATLTQLTVTPFGGLAVSTQVFAGSTAAAVSGSGPYQFPSTFNNIGTLRLFVPSGQFLKIMSEDVSPGIGAMELFFAVIFREIPAQIGVP